MHTKLSYLLLLGITVALSAFAGESEARVVQPMPAPKGEEGDELVDETPLALTGPYWGPYQNPPPSQPRVVKPKPKPQGNRPPPAPPKDWDKQKRRMVPPPQNPNLPRPRAEVPIIDIFATGPETYPGPGIPYLEPVPAGYGLESARLITQTGASIPMSVTEISSLSEVPTSVFVGEGIWTIEWDFEDFVQSEGRYFLLRVDATLGTLFGCPGNGCTHGADADFDGNCIVDLADLATLLSGFGSSAASHYNGDTDANGIVDLTDLANVLSRFGANCEQ